MDLVLKAKDKMGMYEAYAVLGVLDADGNLIQSGMTADGGNWAIYDQGARTYVKGYTMDNEPIYATDEYWSPVRWNSGDPTPALPIEVTVEWRSDADPQQPYPEGVTVFA